MPLWGKQHTAISLNYNSHVSIIVAHNSVYNEKKRHIHIRHSVVKQLLKHGIISLEYVRSEKNLADLLTKGLIRRLVLETLRGMGLNTKVHGLRIVQWKSSCGQTKPHCFQHALHSHSYNGQQCLCEIELFMILMNPQSIGVVLLRKT